MSKPSVQTDFKEKGFRHEITYVACLVTEGGFSVTFAVFSRLSNMTWISSPKANSGRRAAALTVCLTAVALAAPAGADASGCANADLSPQTAEQIAQAETATRCLVNRERRKRGMRGLRYNRNLQKSSAWQANDMVEHAYFDHQRSGGPSFAGRITRFGYSRKANGYTLGENLAYASNPGATPREMVAMWMDSPGHRANILRRAFREQAVAAVLVDGDAIGGDYDGAGPVAIYVNQFGTRY